MNIRVVVIVAILSIAGIVQAEPMTVEAMKEITLSEEALANAKKMSNGKDLPVEAKNQLLATQKNTILFMLNRELRKAVLKLKEQKYKGTLKDSLKKAESLGCKLNDLAYVSYHFADGDLTFKGDETPFITIKLGEQEVRFLQNGDYRQIESGKKNKPSR